MKAWFSQEASACGPHQYACLVDRALLQEKFVPGAGALVILPTFNERENLPLIVPAVLDVLDEAHILVVDDQSPDGTGALADELAAADVRVQVLHREGPRGLGPAYIAGFRWALAHEYTHVFEMDADFSHRPAHLPELFAAAQQADLVLGCRYMDGGGIEGWEFHRRAICDHPW